jgi:plasmid stabilization system protein ParE
MAYKLIWTERASDDLGAMVRYIARHNPEAAKTMGNGIYDRAQILAEFPESGSTLRELNAPQWRHLLFRSYRIVYHVKHDQRTIEIVRVWHAARGDIDLNPQREL